jgi:hypothetical protein
MSTIVFTIESEVKSSEDMLQTNIFIETYSFEVYEVEILQI